MNNTKDTAFIENKYLESFKCDVQNPSNKGDYEFSAIAIKWSQDSNFKWSKPSRNGISYNREATYRVAKELLDRNNGIPIMYNHILEGKDAELLGVVNVVEDREEGLFISGILNSKQPRVLDEIVKGFLNNLSIQVHARGERDEEGISHVYPTDMLEISFVPINGIVNSNLLEISMIEALDKKNIKLDDYVQTSEGVGKVINITNNNVTIKLKENSEYPNSISVYDLKSLSKCETYNVGNNQILVEEDVSTGNVMGAIGTLIPGEEEVKEIVKNA